MTQQTIILTGFMGTGKSTVGRLLAERTGRGFIDTDELIVTRAGREIAHIFAESGEQVFREMEAEVAQELAGRPGVGHCHRRPVDAGPGQCRRFGPGRPRGLPDGHAGGNFAAPGR